MRWAVLGPGGVGGLVAAALDRAGEDVLVVAREETAELIAAQGIEVRSTVLGDWTARPAAAPRLQQPADVLVIATKATGLAEALERIDVEPALVVPLLNGLAHVEPLRERFGTRAVTGTIRVESDRPEPGVVVQTSPFLRIELASADPQVAERVPEVARVLTGAGIRTDVLDSEAEVAWSKLVRLNALALTTTAFDVTLGEIRDDPARNDELEAAVREGAAVARAEGAQGDRWATLGELAEAHPGLTSSMQRDVRAGRAPELAAIAGSVLRRSRDHGIPTPAIERLARRVAARASIPWEQVLD
jgi:2-dehydropantoate 2-reductase